MAQRRDWPAVTRAFIHHTRNEDLPERKYKERDEDGRLPHHWLAAKAQTHTHILASVVVWSICLNPEALTTRDNKGETPIDIASRNGACAEIIGLLSLTPEEARSLNYGEMARLYAPVAYWWDEMAGWIKSRSWADCHKWINEHDDELVREVLLKYCNSNILLQVLNLPNIHRFPLYFAESFKLKAFREIQKGCLPHPQGHLLHPLPHPPPTTPPQTRKCDVCKNTMTKACARCKNSYFYSAECQKSAWKKHKKVCKAPTSPPSSEAELRVLNEGMLLLNRCIQEPGAGDRPTSVVLDFLRDCGGGRGGSCACAGVRY